MGVLITRAGPQESRTPLDELGEVSIVTTRLRESQERRGRWRLGQGVQDADLGVGVVQAFRDDPEGEQMIVRFAAHGPRALPISRPELGPIE